MVEPTELTGDKSDFSADTELLIIRHFFNAETLNRLVLEARSCEHAQAGVGLVTDNGIEFHVDTVIRNVKAIKVPKSTRAFVVERLTALKPDLEKHFNISLSRCEKASFLLYQEGDFYVPHTDNDGQGLADGRKVSIVIFLNSPAGSQGVAPYCGGSLTFFQSEEDQFWEGKGYALTGEAGLLVAFRSDLAHGVTPVTRGERYTIASWFI